MESPPRRDWRTDGVRVIKSDQLDTNTPQTPGMLRAAAIDYRRVGSKKLWAGTVLIHPNAKTGAHHHGALPAAPRRLVGRTGRRRRRSRGRGGPVVLGLRLVYSR